MQRCSVFGCEKQAKISGYCQSHYSRWYRHGDPLAGRTPQGTVREWLENVAIPYDGDGCLSFPFARMKSGHGHISERAHGTSLAHVYVARRVLGPKPDGHECCHSCGNGHLGCCTPKHLRWGTRAENTADRKLHGVFVPPPIQRGAANNRTKLSESDARAIISSLARGDAVNRLAEQFGVSNHAIWAIKNGKTWAWIK
jgi:hypothetical protein